MVRAAAVAATGGFSGWELANHHEGRRLLGDALRRVASASRIVGCVGVVVDAKNAKAEAFYETQGFVVIEDGEAQRRLLLPSSHPGKADRAMASRCACQVRSRNPPE